METKEKSLANKVHELTDEELEQIAGGVTQDQLALNRNEYGVNSQVWAFDTTNKIYRWGIIESIFDEEPDQGILIEVKFSGGYVLTSEGMKTLEPNKSWAIAVYGTPFGAGYK